EPEVAGVGGHLHRCASASCALWNLPCNVDLEAVVVQQKRRSCESRGEHRGLLPKAVCNLANIPSWLALERSRRVDSGARRERIDILDRLEGSAWRVVVCLDIARRRIDYRDNGIDVGESTGEDPVASIDGAAVEDLDDGLYIAGAEEPKIAG